MNALNKYKQEFDRSYDEMIKFRSKNRKIKSNTTLYITYEDMISGIKFLINNLDKSVCYVLLFPTCKIGSENAIILECFNELSVLSIVKVIFNISEIAGSCNLLIIDDCIYTGKNMSHYIDTTVDHLSGNDVYLQFTILTYVSNLKAENEIRKSNRGCTPQPIVVFHNCRRYTANNGYNLPNLYFDHKIHDQLTVLFTPDLFEEGCYPERFPAVYVEKIHKSLH